MMLSVMCLAAMLGACTKARFTVSVDLTGESQGVCRFVYYASDSKRGFVQEAVMPIDKGHGEMQCPTARPTLVWVYTNDYQPSTCFYAERGDKITIKGDIAKPFEWVIGGNDVNDDLSVWRKQNAKLLTNLDYKAINAAVAKYVKQNPDNEASAILLITVFERSKDEKLFDSLRKMLKGDAEELLGADIMTRNDMISDVPDVVKPLKALKIPRFMDEQPDSTAVQWFTVKPSAKRTLLYIWDVGRGEEYGALDSIHAMDAKPGELQTVDLCVTTDSLQWVHYMRNGAVGAQVRGWLPRGLVDPTAMALGVRSLPRFIVVDAKGKVLHSGAKLEDARKFLK